jgi:hypothetical protein
MAIQLVVGQQDGLRSPPPPSSVTLSLAGVGVILLAGAFALLANGMALGFLAFGFSLGVVGTAVGGDHRRAGRDSFESAPTRGGAPRDDDHCVRHAVESRRPCSEPAVNVSRCLPEWPKRW